MTRKVNLLLSVLLVAVMLLASCTTAPATEAPVATAAPEKVTVTWWHISTKDPALSDWQKMADDYMAAHPNVNIEITVLENESFKTKLTTVLQSGEVPDIFQSWGAGTMAEQVKAGLLKDITADLDADGGAWRNTFAPSALGAFSVDGKNYGVPWDMGMIGVWYNKDLFAQAGIDTPPATWSEFLAVCQKLKDAGITPLALGEKDTWTGMHIWAYLVTRIGGSAALGSVLDGTGSFTDAAFVQAAKEIEKLVAMEPFQEGFLGANHDEMQATFGNGKAAMEIMGQWSPTVSAANSADTKGVKNLGMFSFPAVEGGLGDGSDVVGGGNGFAIGKDAEPEAIDFVKYLTSVENQTVIAKSGTGIPTVKGAEAGLTDPNMVLVQQNFSNAKYFQLYYDQLLPSAVGGVINDSIAKLYAGTASAEEVCQTIQDAYEAEMK